VVEIKKLPAVFYCTAAGREPVREWLKGLDEADRRTVGQDIATAEFGRPVGMPVCRSPFYTASSRKRKRRRKRTWTWH
jgi:hypothetical protein